MRRDELRHDQCDRIRNFLPVAKAMSVALRLIINCSSKPGSIGITLASLDAIYLSGFGVWKSFRT